ncbi:LytR/AlgR family response regulator transcription factor [Anaerorhabdus furcosa]|uniref:Two component transcriptional regulator, LytTR family n=1 Tax=Anaerorhabdus furcosa TaxID=118967 RepID=A0A1T4K2P8_9FIRM|nr:LytTR family DNA-binding domain-containing protein [Anaerorhabdus furcosa]SJZ36726.1 two component transcriptional regulator, LytTR family [Anaerorhabdus furcosa]
MSVTICIIDDKDNDLKNIRNEITQHCTDYFDPIIKLVNSVDNLSMITDSDVYFIDIDLPKYNGFEIAKFILQKNENKFIIFVSNREDLVFNSFDLNVFYFVRKSHLANDIERCISKYLQTVQKSNYIILNCNHNTYQINHNEIIWIESNGNNLSIYMPSYNLIVRKTMKSIINELNNKIFIRIHHSYLVNSEYIHYVHQNTCHLKNGLILPISPNHKLDLNVFFSSRR